MSNISIYYQNFRGVRSKLKELYVNIEGEQYDIICGTETWLNPNIYDSEIINTNRYTLLRHDRSELQTGMSRGLVVCLLW